MLSVDPYEENDEGLRPQFFKDLSPQKPHIQLMARRARSLVGIAA